MPKVTKLYTKYLIEDNTPDPMNCDLSPVLAVTAKIGNGIITINSSCHDKKFLFRNSKTETVRRIIGLMSEAVEIGF